jgi:cytoskeletal protein CcmA (bactofilin family)
MSIAGPFPRDVDAGEAARYSAQMLGRNPDSTPSAPASPATRRLADAHDAATVIGPKILIKGEISGEDTIELAGTLEGSARTTGLVRVRNTGRVVGDISAGRLVVEGEVEGGTLQAERIEIGVSARVRAALRSQSVAIAEGAFFEGNVDMDGPTTAPTSFTEKRNRP